MNSMSASDAAPLPRLGEVFFDVRGSSRSMRLSWYSDTGVAVFSIWQGGTCTGTFRLPIEDLPRMTEALQRGPRGAGQPATDVPSLTGLPGGRWGQSGGTSGDIPIAPFAEYATGQHIAPVTGEFRRPELEERATDPFGLDVDTRLETLYDTSVQNLKPDTIVKGKVLNIINDDVSFSDEPMFQDGLISQAVNQVVASEMVCYLRSPQNAPTPSTQRPRTPTCRA